jgi:Fibronectin type III domain
MKPSWEALYAADADVVLNGHSHNYERFAPQTPSGVKDSTRGIREFVVGTGGGAFHGFGTVQDNSEVRNSGTFGVLKLTLHPSSYDWKFVPVAGQTFTDSGTGQCHDNPDSTAPVVQPPQQTLPTGATLGASTIPTKLSWSATDDQGSIASYELQRSQDGGSFTKVSLPSATSTTKYFQLSPSSTYQFRVKATDSAGNSSDWATGPTFLVDAQQENSNAIVHTGSWTQQVLTSAYGGGVEYAKAKGSTAQFTFTGHNVAWVSSKGPDRGKATVSIDGVVVRTIDLYAATTEFRKIVFSQSGLDPTVSHTITVQVLGTKRSASSDTRVDVDALVVLR